MRKIIFFQILIYASIINAGNDNSQRAHKSSHNNQKGGKSHGSKHRMGGGGVIINNPLGIPQPNNQNIPNSINQNGMPIQNPSLLPQQNQNGMPIQNPSLSPQQNQNISYNQPTISNNVKPAIVQLDLEKGAQLIADIKNLEINYKILSEDVAWEVKCRFNNNPDVLKYGMQNPTTPFSYMIKRLEDRAFDPTKEIINVNGGFLPGINKNQIMNGQSHQQSMTMQGSSQLQNNLVINPFTNQILTLNDLPMLQTIRKFYIRLINLEILFLGLNDATRWNVEVMSQVTAYKVWRQQIESGKRNVAYGINALRPSWKSSSDFIIRGELTKKPYMNISDMNQRILDESKYIQEFNKNLAQKLY